jgi:hypothetical protein
MHHRILTLVTLLVCAAFFAARLYDQAVHQFAWDFAINWTAGFGLRTGVPLYDGPAMRDIGMRYVSPAMGLVFTNPYNSYIGPPTTALFHVPFTFLPFHLALQVYRACIMGAFVSAVLLVSTVYSLHGRASGWLWSMLALLLLDPVLLSVWIGQVDAWVMLALAVGIWAWRHERWWWLGAALGAATLLKVSPLLCIGYFLMRRRWQVFTGATLFIVSALILAAVMGGIGNLATFVLNVAPTLSHASLHAENQSLPAWLARLASPTTDLNVFNTGIAEFRLLSPALSLAGVGAFCWLNRGRDDHPMTLPLLVVVALLAGPITWDHYASWAILALPAFADPNQWMSLNPRERRNVGALLLIGGVLLAVPALYFAPAAVAEAWWLRLATGTKTIGLLFWGGVGCWMVWGSRRASQAMKGVDQ